MKQERNIITDTLVVAKTNKTIEEWFTLLDKKGARQMGHIEIFKLISSTAGLKPLGEWNHNLLATTYEWSRGLKERGQKENGFEVSVSKTIGVDLHVLYNAFTDDALRKRWLKQKITIRKSTPDRSARITWCEDESSLSVDFYNKGENKAQVVVQHLKLPGSEKAAAMKAFWAGALEGLKGLLEK